MIYPFPCFLHMQHQLRIPVSLPGETGSHTAHTKEVIFVGDLVFNV